MPVGAVYRPNSRPRANLHGSVLANALAAQLAQQHQAGPVQPQRPAAIMPGGVGQPGLVRWGGQYFNSPDELVAWMRARGVNTTVAKFLAAHAGAAAAFGQRQPHGAGGGVGGMLGGLGY